MEYSEVKEEKAQITLEVMTFLISLKQTDITNVDSIEGLKDQKKLTQPLSIVFIEETNKFWIRHCMFCVPGKCFKEMLKLLSNLGLTKKNSEITSGICTDHNKKMYGEFFEEDDAVKNSVKRVLNA